MEDGGARFGDAAGVARGRCAWIFGDARLFGVSFERTRTKKTVAFAVFVDVDRGWMIAVGTSECPLGLISMVEPYVVRDIEMGY